MPSSPSARFARPGPVACLVRAVALALAVAALAGCSAVRLAYNQADTLLYWRLDGYVDLTAEQVPRVRASLDDYHRWHRRTQLPVYAELLRRIRPQLEQTITPELACGWFEMLRAEVVEPALDPAQWTLVWLAGELSERQLLRIERRQNATDDEWRERWTGSRTASPQGLQEARVEVARRWAERLYGDLDEAQEAALRASFAPGASVFDVRLSLAERLRRQQDLRDVLRRVRQQRPGLEETRELLRTGYIARLLRPPDPALQRYQQALVREGCATFARLHDATTPAQRRHAMAQLQGWEDDLRALAAQSP